MATLDERGHEILDSKPAALPVGFKRPPTLQEQIQRLIRNQLSQIASEKGYESFEESDDFNVGDDIDPASPHELDDDQINAPLPERKPKEDKKEKVFEEEKPLDKEPKRSHHKKVPKEPTPAEAEATEEAEEA